MSGGYDRALTVFSPDGHLLQVEYAAEAVRKGLCAVGVRGADSVVLGVERRAAAKLQDVRATEKIVTLDDKLLLAFAGLQADARVLVDQVRVECQSYRLNMAVPPSADYIGGFIASLQQKFTIRGGRRPFGLSALVGGFTTDGRPALLLSEPHGILTSWRAHAVGRNAKTLQEFLEKRLTGAEKDSINNAPGPASSGPGPVPVGPDGETEVKSLLTKEQAVELTLRALLEVVEANVANVELSVVSQEGIHRVPDETVTDLIKQFEAEKEAALAAGSTAQKAVVVS